MCIKCLKVVLHYTVQTDVATVTDTIRQILYHFK